MEDYEFETKVHKEIISAKTVAYKNRLEMDLIFFNMPENFMKHLTTKEEKRGLLEILIEKKNDDFYRWRELINECEQIRVFVEQKQKELSEYKIRTKYEAVNFKPDLFKSLFSEKL